MIKYSEEDECDARQKRLPVDYRKGTLRREYSCHCALPEELQQHDDELNNFAAREFVCISNYSRIYANFIEIQDI